MPTIPNASGGERGGSQNANDKIVIAGSDNIDYYQTVTKLFSYVPGDLRFKPGLAHSIVVSQSTSGAGYPLKVQSGNGQSGQDVNGGDLTMASGRGQTSGSGVGHGGTIYVIAGNGAGATGNGGDVSIYGGAKAGTGADGDVILCYTGAAAIGMVGIGTGSPTTRLDIAAGAISFTEMTAPSAGASNTARLFAQDNGGGKTQLCVRFPTGTIQVLATEP